MFKLWVRRFKDNHEEQDVIISDDSDDTRTHKIMRALDKACEELDLARPIWLDVNVRDFKKHGKCRFTKDSFIEEIGFDYLEISVLEEDDWFF
ncbi:hypothetical protein [Butyrivibrio sp. MC2013]|uniref:hypothetical protein n=1 Tax=Butyrivibrio sp. MC2013 TaxID=1280686 RepID=UPI0003FDEF72|nr:hypothetical protein [Butyrivibrio sp. MC2013]